MVEQCSDTCGFEALSQNEVLYWSEDLIARFENRWAWDGIYLNTNEALPWSKELIARFESRWNWSRLPSEALTRLTPDHIRQIMSNEQPEKQSEQKKQSEQTDPASGHSHSGHSHSGHSQKLEDAEVETASRFSLEPEALAQKRLEVSVQLMASAAHYIAGKGGLSDPERERASSPPVSTSELNDLLLKGNPEPEDVVRSVTESASGDALQEQLSEALETVEADSVDIDAIETLFEDAEALNGFLPFDTQIEGDEALREHVTDIVERFDLEVDMDLFDQDEDAFWDDFNDAQYTSVGHRFHVLSGYLVILHSMCVVELCYPNRPLSDEQESAVEKIGETYGLKLGDWWSGKKVASMRVNQLMKARSSDSITRRILNSIFDRITLSFGR